MPLGIDSVNPMAIAAMGERYGDRLVNSLTQAGQTIETGLKAVTTIRELKSLGQSLSQLSPESPDYQQQLIGLGASHPFAMQTPQAQQMLQAGNQHHLQWKNQQHAIAMNERQEARADKRFAMSESSQLKRDASQHANRMAEIRARNEGDGDFISFDGQSASPSQGFSKKAAGFGFGAGMDGTQGEVAPAQETAQPPNGFSFGAGQPQLVADAPTAQAAPAADKDAEELGAILGNAARANRGKLTRTTTERITSNFFAEKGRVYRLNDSQDHREGMAAEAATSRATAADILADRKAEAAKLAASERRFLAREKQESNYTPEQKLRLSHIEKQINDLDISETKNRTDSRTLPSKDAKATAAAAAEADRAKIEKLEKDFNDILESKASKGKPGDAAGGRNRDWSEFNNK